MKGFSMLEAMIAVGILILLAVSVWGAFGAFRDARELERASSDVLNLVREARERTLASENNSPFGVYFGSGRAVLFQGTVYAEGAPANKSYALSPRVEAYSISFPGNAVVFERLTGAASASGTVAFRLKNDPSKTRSILVQSSGLFYAQ